MTLKKKLTVAQVLPALESGGVERGTLEIASYLVEKGHNSIVISSGGRLVEELVKSGSEHITINVGNKSITAFFVIFKLRKLILDLNLDILHVRSRLPAWLIFFALKLISKNKRPHFITTVHGFNKVSFYSKIMTKGEHVIAVSNFIKDFIVKNYNLNPKKISVIHRGVPKSLSKLNKKIFYPWAHDFKNKLRINENCKILTLAARVSRTKGIEVFIDLINRLVMNNKNVHAIIVGEAKSKSYLNILQKKIQALGLSKKITFLGYRKDVYNIIQISDISYCLSSVPEPFGRVVIESIKIGTPVISFNYGGAGEQLRNIFPEGLIDNNNLIQLYEKTISFIEKKPKVMKTNLYNLEEMKIKTLKKYLSFF